MRPSASASVEEARRPGSTSRLPPERCPERQGFTRRKAGFDGILMADKVQLCAIGGALGLDWRDQPPRRRRPADRRRSMWRGAARNRLVFAAAVEAPVSSHSAARPAGETDSPAKTRQLAAPACEIPLGDSDRRSVTMMLQLSRPIGAAKKAAPVGENRSRVATVELLDRIRGLGDKPVRINLTHTIWDSIGTPVWKNCDLSMNFISIAVDLRSACRRRAGCPSARG